MSSFKDKFIEAFCGYFLDLECATFLKKYFLGLGCSNFNYLDNCFRLYDFRYYYLLNTTVNTLKNLTNLFFIGTNLRLESPLLNSKVRKSFLKNFSFKAFSIGLGINYLTYPVRNLGNSIFSFLLCLEGRLLSERSFLFKDYFNVYKLNYFFCNLHVFIGMSFLNRFDSNSLFRGLFLFFRNLSLSIDNLHIVSTFMGRISAMEVGLVETKNSFSCLLSNDVSLNSFVYFCGVDFDSLDLNVLSSSNFIVSQSSFFSNKILQFSDIILPSSVYLEKEASYII